jgi:hypothetical protein
MKILFENKCLPPTTVTSLDFSENYPPANLAHIFLHKRYQNKTGADTITFDFLKDVTLNCFFYGFNNGRDLYRLCEDGSLRLTESGLIRGIVSSSMTLQLYDYLDNLLHTETIVQASQFGSVFFDAVNLVRKAKIVIDWAGGGGAYLGGCGMGEVYTMPDPIADWIDSLEDNSIIASSLAGQCMQNFVEPLDVLPFNFKNVSRDQFTEIRDQIKALGKGRPVWVDYFENWHTQFPPSYAQLVDGLENPSKNDRTYSFSLTFKESR